MEVILPAVDAKHLSLSYNKNTPALNGANLLVKKGHIYGLLGPSGCGKTTLLKVVIGLLKPDKGSIHVLGHRPGTIESHIPGSCVGYMPQELSLYQLFTISETLYYFGRLHKMSGVEIEERMKFLLEFLEIPYPNRIVSQLSGGQQRRVSLAVALLHSPQLLILDEPTVGVDPLLRLRIWDHLVRISKENHTSIIITTHYIEEARSANTVGLMRSGRVLAEGTPDYLLQNYNKSSLEDVFLHLCMQDDDVVGFSKMNDANKKLNHTSINQSTDISGQSNEDVERLAVGSDDEIDDDTQLLEQTRHSKRTESVLTYVDHENLSYRMRNCCAYFPKARNVKALFIKNMNQMKRRLAFIMFQFILPAIQISIYSLSIGGVPKDLPIQIVNSDIGVVVPFLNIELSFSEAFISKLDNAVLTISNSNSSDLARQFVKNGTAWAVLEFGQNFSKYSFERLTDPTSAKDPTIVNGSFIDVTMDETNQEIYMTIQSKLIEAYQGMAIALKQQAVDKYNITLPIDSNMAELPILFKDPIYGQKDETFLDFSAPGILCSILYFLAIGLTALTLVIERKEGLFTRSMVSGVTMAEILIGHILAQFIVMAVQVAVLLIFTFLVFKIYNAGSLILVILFLLLLGMMGMCLGFVVSAATKDETEATQLSLALFMPFILISGIIWPIESMPEGLQVFSKYCTPLTLPVVGIRVVFGRGWDLTYYEVWRGYVLIIAWSIGFLIISLIISKIKRFN